MIRSFSLRTTSCAGSTTLIRTHAGSSQSERPAGMHGEQFAKRTTSRDAWRAVRKANDQPGCMAWFKIRVTKDAWQVSGIRMWARLRTPQDMNYDLYLYRDGYEQANLAAASTGGYGATEVVMGRVEDNGFVADHHDYYVEIRYVSGGDSCNAWNLNIWSGCANEPWL